VTYFDDTLLVVATLAHTIWFILLQMPLNLFRVSNFDIGRGNYLIWMSSTLLWITQKLC